MSAGERGLHALVIGQSGGATPVINASLAGVIDQAQRRGIPRILGMAFGIRGLLQEQLVDLSATPRETLAQLARTPSAALGTCRYKLSQEEAARAVAILRRQAIDAFLYIGGNDSAETTLGIARAAAGAAYPLACVGIPKTIDNDLCAMDHTPGYGSAARFVASVARDLGLDAWAMQREEQVRILEVYGRDSGWLAAASVLGRERPDDPPHLVLAPERAFAEDAFLAAVERQVAHQGYCCIVVGEMLRDAAGALVGSGGPAWSDAFGHAESRRPGAYLRELVERRLPLRAKDDRPGSIQKVARDPASSIERSVDGGEAYALGRHAVEAALAGEPACMVVLERHSDDPYRESFGRVSLEAVAGRVRPLPEAFLDADGRPTDAFRRYALPLIGGRLKPRARLDLGATALPFG